MVPALAEPAVGARVTVAADLPEAACVAATAAAPAIAAAAAAFAADVEPGAAVGAVSGLGVVPPTPGVSVPGASVDPAATAYLLTAGRG